MNTGLWNMDSGLAAALRPGMTTEDATVATEDVSGRAASGSGGRAIACRS
jgi:mevalonate pyrophosphate decarboxylase